MPEDESPVKPLDPSDVEMTPEEEEEEGPDPDLIEWGGFAGFSSYEEAEASGWRLDSNEVGDNSAVNAMVKSINGIMGVPYQFDTEIDIPYETGATVGRKYMEKILSVMPVMFVTPGEPVFMDGYGKDAKKKMVDKLLNNFITEHLSEGGVDDEGSTLDELAGNDDGRYYSFGSQFAEYCKYANMALRVLAQFMNIGHVKIPTANGGKTRLRNVRVQDLLSNSFRKAFAADSVIPFYLDAETSITENFSNDTTESILSQTANQGSEIARQIQFVAGSHDPGGIVGAVKDAVSGAGDSLLNTGADLMNNLGSSVFGNGLINRVTSELTTIVTGGKIVFPEMWNSSSYSKSYNITMKLRSPDPDPVSIFLNIYAPIILWVSMAAPRQVGNSANSYASPFLVRCTYKSIFNVDLGIVQSLDITTGGEDKWNALGQPTQAEITVTIKDLYSTMFISKGAGIINNTAQMDYLALKAGVDMNRLEATRMINLAAMMISNVPEDILVNAWSNVKESLNKRANKILGILDPLYRG